MRSFEYCKPINAKAVPAGPDWIHEVKYDGYRGRAIRDGRDVKMRLGEGQEPAASGVPAGDGRLFPTASRNRDS